MNENKLSEATRLEMERNFEAAIALLLELVRDDPTCIEAYVHLAADSGILKRFRQAEQYARMALRMNPQYGRARYYLACALRNQFRLDEAYQEMEKALSLIKRDASAGTLAQSLGIELPVPKFTSVPGGMKTYRNEKHGFEIDMPEEWAPAPAVAYGLIGILSAPIPKEANKDCFQYGCRDEAFNFEIGPLFPEPLLSDTEREFTLYAQSMGFKDMVFGRIIVGDKEHVCAHYYIDDKMGKRWNKKYMIVFGGIEYTITGTCNDLDWFTRREKDWDTIVKTFHLLAPVDNSINSTERAERGRNKRREIIDQRIEMREITGDLYARAYEAVAVGQYAKARALLEECLRDTPNHVLAHKELAVVLKKMGDIPGALRHRRDVKRLAPDDTINRANLVELLAGSGKKGEALRETRDILTIEPNHPVFQKLENKLVTNRFVDYRILFLSSLVSLLLLDTSLLMPEYIAIKHVWCVSLLMIMPVYGMFVSGPWVGIPRTISGLVASVLYLLFLLKY
jgi:tetratricopeptide (TPR) repeat protein